MLCRAFLWANAVLEPPPAARFSALHIQAMAQLRWSRFTSHLSAYIAHSSSSGANTSSSGSDGRTISPVGSAPGSSTAGQEASQSVQEPPHAHCQAGMLCCSVSDCIAVAAVTGAVRSSRSCDPQMVPSMEGRSTALAVEEEVGAGAGAAQPVSLLRSLHDRAASLPAPLRLCVQQLWDEANAAGNTDTHPSRTSAAAAAAGAMGTASAALAPAGAGIESTAGASLLLRQLVNDRSWGQAYDLACELDKGEEPTVVSSQHERKGQEGAPAGKSALHPLHCAGKNVTRVTKEEVRVPGLFRVL